MIADLDPDDHPGPGFDRAAFGLSTDPVGPQRILRDLVDAHRSVGAWACSAYGPTLADAWPPWFCAALRNRIEQPHQHHSRKGDQYADHSHTRH